MSRVALRVLIRNIDDLIAQESYQKAFLQARHVLYHFPKYLEAYRVMGKAFLEARQYSNALDIFLRLLSAVPDDFLAHVALSIIREEEGDLEAALWHMERAFEVQPSNLLVQEELQRLYREREGVAPPRIHPTRATLARIYVRAGLYPQAIVELEALLKEHPKRYDLMGLLSEVYERMGQDQKAMEMAARLLRVLPYHWTANWVMARLLRRQGKEEEAQRYWDRIIEMDPYAAHISDEWPTPDQVPDDLVTLPEPEEMEEWEEELPVLGEGLEDLFVLEAESSLLSALPGEAPTTQAPEEAETPQEAPSLPDWFLQAETEPKAQEEAAAPSTEEEEAVPDLEPGEIPEWLKAIAQEASEETSAEQEAPAWLDEILGSREEAPEPFLPEAEAALAGTEEASSEASEEALETFPMPPVEEAHGEPEELPWLQEAAETPPAPMPDVSQAPEPSMEDVFASSPETPEPAEEVPAPPEAGPEPEAPAGMPPEALEDERAVLAWLEALASKQGVPEEELITEPEERPPVEEGPTMEPEAARPEEAPAEVLAFEDREPSETEVPEAPPGPRTGPLTQEALEERLGALAYDESAASDEAGEAPFAPVEQEGWPEFEEPTAIPEPEPPAPFLEEEAEAFEPVPETPESPPADAVPAETQTPEIGFPLLEDERAALAWLEALASKQGVPEEELITRPEERPPVEGDEPQVPEAEVLEEVPRETPAAEDPVSSGAEGPGPSTISLAQEILEERLNTFAFEEGQAALKEETPFGSVEREGWPEFEEPTSIPEPEPLEAETALPQVETEPTFASPESPSPEATPGATTQEERFPPLEDEDSTLAWLEALAAKHGVPEEELITRPEERPEVPETPSPTQTVVEVPSQESTQEKPEVLEEMPPEVLSGEPETGSLPSEPSVTAAEGGGEAPAEAIPMGAEAPTQTEGPEDTPSAEEEEEIPAWLRLIEEEEEGEVVTEAEIPEWEYVEDLDMSAAEEPGPAAETPTGAPVTPPAAQVVEVPKEPEEAPEAPVAEEAVQEEAPPQEEPVQETPSAVEETAPLDPQLLEAWLRQLEQERAEREEEEALLVTEAGFAETPAPVSEGPSEPVSLPSPTIEQRTLPDTPEARMIQEAREALRKNDLERALSLYRKVMRKKRYLDVVIEDLYQAQYEHPMSVELLILLGDACARAGRLQEAMDTYWKAEQLVR